MENSQAVNRSQGRETQLNNDVYLTEIDPLDEVDLATQGSFRRTWKGENKIALLQQAIVERLYQRFTSETARAVLWQNLTISLGTGESTKAFFGGMHPRYIQEKLNGILKNYKSKNWAALERGLQKETKNHQLRPKFVMEVSNAIIEYS